MESLVNTEGCLSFRFKITVKAIAMKITITGNKGIPTVISQEISTAKEDIMIIRQMVTVLVLINTPDVKLT
ncbi:MAG: hypothetical protein NUK63_05655 [Candidatus Bathyarchaeum tardum]|nr:MAG: hypothetical protein NUK63_05655 [Candidatus Bathyarchaeum tardum]